MDKENGGGISSRRWQISVRSGQSRAGSFQGGADLLMARPRFGQPGSRLLPALAQFFQLRLGHVVIIPLGLRMSRSIPRKDPLLNSYR